MASTTYRRPREHAAEVSVWIYGKTGTRWDPLRDCKAVSLHMRCSSSYHQADFIRLAASRRPGVLESADSIRATSPTTRASLARRRGAGSSSTKLARCLHPLFLISWPDTPRRKPTHEELLCSGFSQPLIGYMTFLLEVLVASFQTAERVPVDRGMVWLAVLRRKGSPDRSLQRRMMKRYY